MKVIGLRARASFYIWVQGVCFLRIMFDTPKIFMLDCRGDNTMIAKKSADKQIQITIEQMKPEDIEAVAELDTKCFPTPWSVSAYSTEVHNPNAYYIVARHNSKIVGYAGMWLVMEEAHITTIGVDPDFRGMKIGERMLVNLLDEAIHRGARRATLEVREHNLIAQNLYRKYGFYVAAIRRGYYTDNNENALVMWIDDLWDENFLRNLRINREKLREAEW